MKAIGKYLVIECVKTPNVKTKGGLILADSHREDIRYRQAVVVKPGTNVEILKEGDNIYYDKNAGFNIEINKETYKVIKEHDVVIIL